MAQHIIIICIVSILLWYYYIKSKEQDDKYIPVMVRHSELMHENNVLKQENKKLKLRLKYLENYKQDVSKTFKILDNELGLINEHILKKKNQEIQNQQEEPVPVQTNNNFESSLTPTVLNSLIRESQEPSDSLNNIFNRFLTGDVNFMNTFSSYPSRNEEISQEQSNDNQDNEDNIQDNTGPQNDDGVNPSNTRRLPSEVHFSVNYLPLNSSYRQFLIRRDPVQMHQQSSESPSRPVSPQPSSQPHVSSSAPSAPL